jgi:hypothetical protein
LSAKDLPGGLTKILNVCWIQTLNHHTDKSDEHSAPESNSDTEDWANRNNNLGNPIDSIENCTTDIHSDLV